MSYIEDIEGEDWEIEKLLEIMAQESMIYEEAVQEMKKAEKVFFTLEEELAEEIENEEVWWTVIPGKEEEK